MSRLAHFGDFVLGVALLGATPILVFTGCTFIETQISLFEGDTLGDFLGRRATFGISFLSFILACRWRRTHRRIPISAFPLEVILSVICGLGFMYVLLLSLWAVGGAD